MGNGPSAAATWPVSGCICELTTLFSFMTSGDQQSSVWLTQFTPPFLVYTNWQWSSAFHGTKLADPVSIYFGQNDLALFPQAYASSVSQLISLSASKTTTTTINISSSASPGSKMSPSRTAGPDTGPSAGASGPHRIQIGIAVGTILAGLIFIAVIGIWICHGRKRKGKQTSPSDPELDGRYHVWKVFMRGRWRAEMAAPSYPLEIDSRPILIIPGPPRELDDSSR